MKTSIQGALLATAVAGLMGCSSATPMAKEPSGVASTSVRCGGINECKGMAECSGNGHPCGKHTPCKGQGWVTAQSAEACLAKGGKVL